MPRVDPLPPSALPDDLRAIVASAEAYMGFVANDALTMARHPQMLRTALPFMRSIYADGAVGFELKRLVAMMSSWAAGCEYCVAHTAHGAARLGVAEQKLAALPEFERSDLFTPAERAALCVARGSGQVPCAVSDAEFAELRRHFSEDQIIEIVGVIALFGFLNRWNALLATELEASPLAFARRALGATGWQPGSHADGHE